MKKLLIGTGNKTRLEYLKGMLQGLNMQVVGLKDVGITSKVAETGKTPLENSVIKAESYSKIACLPTLSVDTGLYIECFPKENQPGLHVRRIGKNQSEVSDSDMLDYYVSELKRYGGESSGYWEIGISLAFQDKETAKTVFRRETKFTPFKSLTFSEHEPLNSIQIDLKTGKYVSDLSVDEKIASQSDLVSHIYEFVKKHI